MMENQVGTKVEEEKGRAMRLVHLVAAAILFVAGLWAAFRVLSGEKFEDVLPAVVASLAVSSLVELVASLRQRSQHQT